MIYVITIAQLAPLSFYTSIPHKPRQVRWGGVHASVVTEWSLACLHKLLPTEHQRQQKKTSNGRSSQISQYFPYKPHSNFKPTYFVLRFCVCPSNDTFDKNKKISMLVLGVQNNYRKSTDDKANISNPKVNRGCPPLTGNRTSADCVHISLGPSIQYILLRVYRTGGFNAKYTRCYFG